MPIESEEQRQTLPPIFILSSARSGSTLLRYIVDTHPEICSPAELNLGPLCQSLYYFVHDTLGQICGASDKEKTKAIVNAEVRRIVSEQLERYTRARQKRTWCEKTPVNLKEPQILHDVFPDAKYICLYRNCMDVVHSCMEFSRVRPVDELMPYILNNPQNRVAGMVEFWLDRTSELLKFERKHKEQCFSLKYESLVTNPAETLKPMFEFLGVAWNPDIVDAVFAVRHDKGSGDIKVAYSKRIHPGSIGKGSSISRREIPNNLLKRMNLLLEELSYPAVGPNWDYSPSPYLTTKAEDAQGGRVAAKPHMTERGTAERTTIATVEDVFKSYIPRQLKKHASQFQEMSVRYKMLIDSDASTSAWLIDLGQSGEQIRLEDGPADCVLKVSSEDLVDLVKGKLSPRAAFEQGKLQVSHDEIELARLLAWVLFGDKWT